MLWRLLAIKLFLFLLHHCNPATVVDGSTDCGLSQPLEKVHSTRKGVSTHRLRTRALAPPFNPSSPKKIWLMKLELGFEVNLNFGGWEITRSSESGGSQVTYDCTLIV